MTIALDADARAGAVLATGGRRARALAYLPWCALGVDVVAIGAAGLAAVLGRDWLMFDGDAGFTGVGLVGLPILAAWVVMIALGGGYSSRIFGAGPDEYKRVANASLVTFAVVGIGCYLAKFQLSRGFFLLLALIGIPLLLLGRFALRRALHRAHRAGRLRYRVVIAGRPSHVDEVAAVLRRESWLGYDVVGALTPIGHASDITRSGISVIGDSHELAQVAIESRADAVFIANGAFRTSGEIQQVAWELENHRTQVFVAPSVTDVSRERVTIRPIGGLPLVHLEQPRALAANRWAKRAFDLVAASLLVVLLSPLLLASALRVRMYDGGPVLFRQIRVGRDGREFACLKFRTMVTDAEERLGALRQETGFSGGLFKLKDDPRVTKPGRFLRRYSLDELPQLINVLRGEMSLVGPRPPLPAEVAAASGEDAAAVRRRLRVPPGMTGLWQVSGRSDLSWDEAIRLDVYYVDNWSLMQDLAILARTVGAVLGSRGAY